MKFLREIMFERFKNSKINFVYADKSLIFWPTFKIKRNFYVYFIKVFGGSFDYMFFFIINRS
jgi:hypothetical protein